MLPAACRCEEAPILQCSVCGRLSELVEVPGRSEWYCFECSADIATSILLKTEIDAAILAGLETKGWLTGCDGKSVCNTEKLELPRN